MDNLFSFIGKKKRIAEQSHLNESLNEPAFGTCVAENKNGV